MSIRGEVVMCVVFEIIVGGKVIGTLETATAQYRTNLDGLEKSWYSLPAAVMGILKAHPEVLFRPLLEEW